MLPEGGVCTQEFVLELAKLVSEAELTLLGMSGSGLGAVLLAAVALAVVLRSRSGQTMATLLKAWPAGRKRND